MSQSFPRFNTMEEMEEFYYGPSKIKKADDPVLTTDPGWWQTIFGRKVWSWLDYEKNVFAILPKAPWRQSGWRVMTAPAFSWAQPTGGAQVPGGVDEHGAMPDTAHPTWAQLGTRPKTMIHGFNTSEVAEFLSGVDDAIDLLPELRREFGLEHAAIINTALITDVEQLAAAATADWAGTNNFETLDRIISSDSEEDAFGGTYAGYYDAWKKYATTEIDRDASTTYDAIVDHNSGTDRDLVLSLIDALFTKIWKAGGKPKVIVTGYDTKQAWQQLLEAERRFMETARVVPTFAGIRGVAPGVEAGFFVATYHGIPILETAQMPADTISRIFVLDTDFLELRIAKPTRYYETAPGAGYIYLNKVGIEGAYETMGELLCNRFNIQAKLRDLK